MHDLVDIPETSEKKKIIVFGSNNNNEDKHVVFDILIWTIPYHLLISMGVISAIQQSYHPIYCILVIDCSCPRLFVSNSSLGSSIAFLLGAPPDEIFYRHVILKCQFKRETHLRSNLKFGCACTTGWDGKKALWRQ